MKLLALLLIILLLSAIFIFIIKAFSSDTQDNKQSIRKVIDIARNSQVLPIFEYGIASYKAVAIKFREQQLFYVEISWNDKRVIYDVLDAKQLEKVHNFCLQFTYILGEKTKQQHLRYFEEIPSLDKTLLGKKSSFARNRMLKQTANKDINLLHKLREETKPFKSELVIKQALEQGKNTDQILEDLDKI